MAGPRNQEVAELTAAIERLELRDVEPQAMQALQARYISYVDWLESAATRSRRGHYVMRLTAVIGGVVVTSMSSAEVLGDPGGAVQWILLGTSLAVGMALGVDGLLNLGDRWRHYRGASETFKSQGWRFIQRTGDYARLSDADAVRSFATKIEDLIDTETGGYIRGPAQTKAAPSPGA